MKNVQSKPKDSEATDIVTGEVTIQQARCEHAQGISTAIRSGFEPAFLQATIYGCAGIANFIASQISLPNRFADTAYTVALQEDQVVGAVELRRSPAELFLNYISLLPQFRGRGLAGRILKGAIDSSMQEGQTRMVLDVSQDNSRALAWYKRLGLKSEHRVDWFVIGNAATGEATCGLVSEYPQAETCHAAYGFSAFGLTTPSGVYRIGRINADWFRITQPEALLDPSVLPSLRALDPSRRVLAILDQGAVPVEIENQGRRWVSKYRMSADLVQVITNLS